ncbi:MAG: tetratricopeptide repeat protein, partial [Planctomycetota bacterium]
SARQTAASTAASLRQYRLGDELGRGGMGEVRAAIDNELRRQVAIKLLRSPGSANDATQFVEEAQITGQLEHPNIVPVHQLGVDASGRPWLAMKKIDGVDLRERIRHSPRGLLDAAQLNDILEVFGKICDAIAFAHHRGVIHRDLKPANVMIGEWGEVLVVDWGLARPLASSTPSTVRTDRRDGASDITLDGDVFGTPAYMPPEQASGRIDEVDERADIFALGAILYEMLTLHVPYEGRNARETLAKATRRDLVPPRQRAPQRAIPREIHAIVMKAMAARPADRYATVGDLRADLAAWTTHTRGSAWRDGPIASARKWAKRHPQLTLAGTLMVVATLVVATVVGQWQASERARELAVAENDRLRLESERAELRDLAQRDQIDGLRERLGLKVRETSAEALRQFNAEWKKAKQAGRSEDALVRELGPRKVDEILDAMNQLIDSAGDVGAVQLSAPDYYQRGLLRSVGKGDHAGALEDYNRTLELDADFHPAYAGRAFVYLQLGDTRRALDDLDRAVQLLPDAENLANRGSLRLHRDDIDGAQADFDRALELDARCLPALLGRANIHRIRKQWTAAVEVCTTALTLYPQSAVAWFGRGFAYEKLRDDAQAIADYDATLRLDPAHHGARLNRGEARSRTGDLIGALADLTYLLEQDPDNAEALTNRGNVRGRLGDEVGALQDVERAIQVNPQLPEAFNNRGSARHQRGDLEGALADFNAAIALDDSYAMAIRNRGVVLDDMNDLDGAIRDYTRAIELDPLYAQAYFTRAISRRKKGDEAGALDDYTKALELAPGYSSALCNRGSIYLSRGRYDLALADFDAAIRSNSTYWQAWTNRAAALAQLGRKDESRRSFEQALACCPGSQRAMIEARRKHYLGE